MDLDPALILLIAGESSSDPRTVRRVLRGERVRQMVEARIRAAMRVRGVSPATRNTEPPPRAA